MNSRVRSSALKQHVMTIFIPGMLQGNFHHRLPVSPAAMFGMGHDIFEKGVLTAFAKQIWCHDQHASRNNLVPGFANEHSQTRPFESVRPDGLGSI